MIRLSGQMVYCLHEPQPLGFTLSSDGSVFACGDGGTVLQYRDLPGTVSYRTPTMSHKNPAK